MEDTNGNYPIINNPGYGDMELLDKRGKYSLLHRIKGGYTPWVVAYDLSDDGSWGQGHYFTDEESARDYFNNNPFDESCKSGKLCKKKSLKESNSTLSVNELANKIKKAVEWLQDSQEGCYTIKLDNRLAVCVGWESGYSANDNRCIHSIDEPEYCIVAGIKVWTSDSMRTDYEWINYPYYANGDVWDDGASISPNENYIELANWFMEDYNTLSKHEISEDGQILYEDDLDESYISRYCKKKSLNEAPDIYGLPTDYEIDQMEKKNGFSMKGLRSAVSATRERAQKKSNIKNTVYIETDTKSTRTNNYEYVTLVINGKKGEGSYKWQNRPWYKYRFASALQSAIKDATGDSKYAEDCIKNTSSIDEAKDWLMTHSPNTNESLKNKKLNESTSNFSFENICLVVTDEDFEDGNYPEYDTSKNYGSRSYPAYPLIDYNDNLSHYVITLNPGYYGAACIDYIEKDDDFFEYDGAYIAQELTNTYVFDDKENQWYEKGYGEAQDKEVSEQEVRNYIKKVIESYGYHPTEKDIETIYNYHYSNDIYDYFALDRDDYDFLLDEKQKELEIVNSRIEKIKRKYGYIEYAVSARFSNGETWYSPVD